MIWREKERKTCSVTSDCFTRILDFIKMLFHVSLNRSERKNGLYVNVLKKSTARKKVHFLKYHISEWKKTQQTKCVFLLYVYILETAESARALFTVPLIV
jgi:hypothetical protein